MTKTRALALVPALLLALAACTTSGNRDTASTTTTAEASTTSTTEPAIEWTTAMQNACTAEADRLRSAINAFRVGDENVTLARIYAMGYITTTPTYWTVERSQLVGIDANEDSRCGGMYLP